jgi:toxin-antitoxin system PIN domain toxin
VILVDANLLILSVTEGDDSAAADWLERQLWEQTRVGMPWPSLLAFVRVVTNQRIFPTPVPLAEAWKQVVSWLDCDPVWIPQPTERHADVLGQLLKASGTHGNLVVDAHLAALALEHGLTVCSNDSDFARFRGVKWLNPLAPKQRTT